MQYEHHAGTTVLSLSVEFDLACEKRFEEELERRFDDEVSRFMLDLRGLEFIDSTGLRMIVQIDAIARRDGFDFSVLCGDGQVRRVLHETGLDGVLPIVDPSGVVSRSDARA